ncbi:MAG: hypothetical protein WA139_05635 [Candidatus Aenigmatarchaeota archaeon]
MIVFMENVFVKHVEKLDYSAAEDLIRQTVGEKYPVVCTSVTSNFFLPL